MNGNIDAQVQFILAAITRKYVITESKIPAEVLALKDEVMEIFAKAKQADSPEVIEQYERRLAEIRESIATPD